jgi:hypothetical protein
MKDSQGSGVVRTADLIPLERVPALLPNRPDRSTVFRWVSKGCCGVRLRTVSVGRTRHTTERWLLEFFEEVAAARECKGEAHVVRTGRRRRTEVRTDALVRTAQILREHGLSESG